ncbi:MAG: hypothetical protein LIP12_18560 [Clostridiales bacterium]|nr:hypothetical protein [Clostridiales bacterium]
MAGLRAGAERRVIQIPPEYLAVENFGVVHDPIHARAVAICQDGNTNDLAATAETGDIPRADTSKIIGTEAETILLVSLEITSMPGEEVDAIRARIAEENRIKIENIWVCVTHSFSSPHLLPDHMFSSQEQLALREKYREALQSAAVGAAKDAMEQLRPACLGIGTGECGIVASRDIELDDGWWVGTNGDGPTDRTLTVLRLDDLQGQPIALISHFAIQSSVMDQSVLSDGRKPITPDVSGLACRKAEKESGDSLVALFLIGAAADQAPIEKSVHETFANGQKIVSDQHEKGFEICGRLSDILKSRICEIAQEASFAQDEVPIRTISASLTVPAKHMNRDLHSLRPTRAAVYEPDGESETTIEAIRIGDLALLGVKPELTCMTAASIMDQSGFSTTLVCTLVNGASKYMADESAYDRCCYEAQNSPFGRGAAEMLAKKAAEVLGELL